MALPELHSEGKSALIRYWSVSPYSIPLETESDILVTSHGMRSISGIECGIDINSATKNQLEALPGIGAKASWRIISSRATRMSKDRGLLIPLKRPSSNQKYQCPRWHLRYS